MKLDTGKYRVVARDTFAKFRAAIETPDRVISYWRFGTAFDTMTDYLLLLKQSSDPDDTSLYNHYLSDLAAAREKKPAWKDRVDPYAQYLWSMVVTGSACCYDDFCWWGIASAKALPGSPYHDLFVELFGEADAQAFQQAALAIWEVVYHGNYAAVVKTVPDDFPNAAAFKATYAARGTYHGGSPNAWARVQADTPKGLRAAYAGAEARVMNVEPRFPNGMWQYDYYWDPTYLKTPGYVCAKNTDVLGTSSYTLGAAQEACGQDGNPNSAPNQIGPFQLTLMNGLMWVYAARLQAWTGSEQEGPYLPVAIQVKAFLDNWFALPEPDTLLWQYGQDADKVLVRERMGTYKNNKPVPGAWNETLPRVWCGDQGLILGGMVYHQEADGSGPDAAMNDRIAKLVAGTLDPKGPLFEPASSDKPGSLQSFHPVEGWGCDHLFCLRDYWSGAGIFWRYLFQTYRSSATVRAAVAQHLEAVQRSADAACAAPTMPWNAATPWPTQDAGALFEWFNPLATLTAAIYVLENPDGPSA